MPSASVLNWDDVTPYGDERADRRVMPGRGGDLKRVIVKAGHVAARHEHDFEQFFMVQEGGGTLTCAAGEIALKPGVVIHFEPHAWHSAVFHHDTMLIEINFAR